MNGYKMSLNYLDSKFSVARILTQALKVACLNWL